MLAEWCSIWKCLQCNVWILGKAVKKVKTCVMQVGICASVRPKRNTCPLVPRGCYIAYQTLLSSRDLCFHYLLPLRHVNILPTLCPHVFIKVCSTPLVVNIFEFPMHLFVCERKTSELSHFVPKFICITFPHAPKTAYYDRMLHAYFHI